MKRVFDLLVAATGLALLALPMLGLIALIRLSDGGPAFYRQQRVGRGCKPFYMLKFRSMVVDADSLGGYATATGDPRITPIGRVLRRTSMDELPQLWNVLMGDMSVVGPRPDVPAQRAQYAPDDWKLRHSVRPGVTGLAQATARSNATSAERTALDLQYVRNPNVLSDLYIIALTIRQVLAPTGN